MNEAQVEKYQTGNKGFGLVGSADVDSLQKKIAELEAQLPKVVTPHNAENAAWLAWWRCDCGDIVLFDAKYCQECGAKLDWTGVGNE